MDLSALGLAPVANPELESAVMRAISVAWGRPTHSTYFSTPLANPVAMRASQLPLLSGDAYLVSLKLDGVAMVLVLTTLRDQPVAVLVNRRGDMVQVRVRADLAFFDGTVLAGELVDESKSDIVNLVASAGAGTARWSLNLFECYSVAGTAHTEQAFVPRYEKYVSCVDADVNADQRIVCEHPGLVFRAKPFFRLTETPRLLALIAAARGRGVDGLIFMPMDGPCVAGTQWNQFKWKPPALQTVDLRTRAGAPGTPLELSMRSWDRYAIDVAAEGILTHDDAYASRDIPRAAVRLPFGDATRRALGLPPVLYCTVEPDEMSETVNRLHAAGRLPDTFIAEFAIAGVDAASARVSLRLLRVRNDKGDPNMAWTVQQTVFIALENIGAEALAGALRGAV